MWFPQALKGLLVSARGSEEPSFALQGFPCFQSLHPAVLREPRLVGDRSLVCSLHLTDVHGGA